MKPIVLSVLLLIAGTASVWADQIRVAVTTSFYNSGLSEILLPAIERDLGLEVQLLVVGTGQALRLGKAGDVDAILVHSRHAEDVFVAEGFGAHRREIMYNDFVFIGPKHDPAKVGTALSAVDAITKIAVSKVPFVSRGDDSGTHKKELGLWSAAGFVPLRFQGWYKAVGAGMGAALNTAAGMNAYIMSDRASWLNFGNKADLAVLYAGDPVLHNQYAYIPVNPKIHTHAKFELAKKLEGWLVSDKAKVLINSYKIEGKTLFVFNAKAK